MEQNKGQNTKTILGLKKKTSKKPKSNSYLTVFGLMIFGLLVIFSYVYQSTKQVYLNYEIVNLNKEINELNIRLMESKVENERLQTNEAVEKIASEKLGMSYEKADKVVVVKEELEPTQEKINDDKIKIKIFMKSLFEETNKQLNQFSFENISSYFSGK